MAIDKLFAHASCTDLSASTDWYRRLFDRAPDATPMVGLAEWHHGEHAGFQLAEDAARAGQQTLTLIVDGLSAERARLADSGLEPGGIEAADTASLVRLRDPDDNLVVLAQPERA